MASLLNVLWVDEPEDGILWSLGFIGSFYMDNDPRIYFSNYLFLFCVWVFYLHLFAGAICIPNAAEVRAGGLDL